MLLLLGSILPESLTSHVVASRGSLDGAAREMYVRQPGLSLPPVPPATSARLRSAHLSGSN